MTKPVDEEEMLLRIRALLRRAKIVSEQKAKWCTGQGDIEAEWDTYIESLNKVGLEKYMEIQNTAYDRYMGS